ncbi:SRPBCC domain-containing protein [Anatilimnocola sp. NA78]|uniref:SRPBCC family protein n=1 Tax=Anatilimnocola sp. NA78 TaxID=3415683 RepID=UPI003CE53888
MHEPKSNFPVEPQVFISRMFDAPRELVFRAWTDPAQLPSWFAPRGCSVSFRQLDIRSGGSFHSCIQTPDGYECWCAGEYREVVPNERIVFTMAVANAAGELVEPTAVGMDPSWPRETIVTVTFEEVDGKTKLTLRQTVNEALAKKTGAHPSWLQMLDRLAEQLPSGQFASVSPAEAS